MSGFLAVDPRDPTPLYVQLERAIRAAIATGRLAGKEQLPTVRQLAVDLRINANTVAKVYGELEKAGVLETRRGVGTFVSTRPLETRERTGRGPLLRAFASRLLAEAAKQGFTLEELIKQLNALRGGG